MLKLGFEVLNQNEEVVQIGSIVLLMQRRPGGTQILNREDRRNPVWRHSIARSTRDPRPIRPIGGL